MVKTADLVSYFLVAPGPRPPYYRVPRFLWGENCNFDSDGDSEPNPHTTQWTELYVALRPDCKEIVTVDPIEAPELVLCISSKNPELAYRAASFLQKEAGGELRKSWP